MTHNFEHKGHQITVWTEKLGAKYWTYEFSAGQFPVCKNDDSGLPTEQAAVDEALREAKSMLDGL